MEEHANLHRQHYLGDLSDRHIGGLCYTAGIAGVTGQGDDDRRHDSGSQLYRPLDSALAAKPSRQLCHLHFFWYI